MPMNWEIFLRILLAILRILGQLPPDTDHREITNSLADAVDLEVNSGGAAT